MEDLNVAIRLKGFIESEGLSHSQFADRCGIPRPSLSQLLSGRNKKISDVLVGQIHKAFPQLSVLWLMFGEGSMLVEDANIGQTASSQADLFSEIQDFSGNPSVQNKFENVSALNQMQIAPKLSDYKQVDVDLKIVELQKQIDVLKKNPRKVSHITVYYDDSTFETFYPKN